MLEIQIQSLSSILASFRLASPDRCLALLVPSGFDFSQDFAAGIDDMTGGALQRAIAVTKFKGDVDQSCVLIAPTQDLTQIVVVGYGDEAEATATRIESAAALAVSLFKSATSVDLACMGSADRMAEHAAYGATLGQYAFTKYKQDNDTETALKRVTVCVSDVDTTAKKWAPLQSVAIGVARARDLVNEPGNILHPPEFARRIETLRDLGITVEILNASALTELGFGALLGVAQGSDKKAQVAIMHYKNAEDAPIAFIGKGVTFDSGGISIKPANGMEEMKTDMGGAAAVVGTMEALAHRKARVNALGIVGLVENMLSGNAQRPGDIVKSYSGKTIEVLNTDAEGRLVLADVLAYARDKYKPQLMIDLATLTGAIVISLGHEYAGLFSNNDTLRENLVQAGQTSGELLWPMPMGAAYDRELNTPIADMKNIGSRAGGSITAAQFLARFVGDTPWAHLDIAGVAARNDYIPTCPKGASGFGVKLLDQLVLQYETGQKLV